MSTYVECPARALAGHNRLSPVIESGRGLELNAYAIGGVSRTWVACCSEARTSPVPVLGADLSKWDAN